MRAGRRAEATGLHEALAELLARGARGGWIVSCYQKLEPADRVGEKTRIKLKNRLRRAADRLEVLGFTHADRETVHEALGRIEEFFRDPSNIRGGRGVAVFAGTKYFRAVPLPYVLKSRVLVDRTPVVSELVALAEARSRVLVVATDRKSARFFDVNLDQVTELDALVAPEATRPSRFHPGRSDAPGVGEYRFHNRIREEKQRHLARVADAVAALRRRTPFDGLLIGGIGVEASALTAHLRPSLGDRRAVGVVQLTPRQVTPAEIGRITADFLDDRARGRAVRDVDALVEARDTGWGVDGVESTLRALSRGQVATLLVDAEAEVPGFRLATSGRLTTEASASRGEGEPVPVADLLDDAIEEALRQRTRVSVVRDAPALRFDRLAGILRFQTAR